MSSFNQDILEYHEKYSCIPKDYMERLAYLYRAYPYKKSDLESLIRKIDRLANVAWDSITYIFYMNPKSSPRPRLNTKTFTFYVKDAKNFKQVFDEFKESHSDMDCVISTPCMIETKSYIEKQLVYAGHDAPIFSEDAMKMIYDFSAGIPRLINRACTQSLIYAYQNRRTIIDDRMVQIVLESEVS